MHTAYGKKEEQKEEKYKKYSINKLFIMHEKNSEYEFITKPPKNKTDREFLEYFLESVYEWRKANPEATVNIWYDRETVTPEQIAATQKILNEKAATDPSWGDIKLKDIREIPVVKAHPWLYSTRIPIYEKVDLAKLLIGLYETETEGNDATIVADIDVGKLSQDKAWMTKEGLFFDKNIRDNFEKYGFMQTDNKESDHIENQFYQILNKPETLKKLKIYINYILECIETSLNRKVVMPAEYSPDGKPHILSDILSINSIVYTMQSLLFTLLLNDLDTIKVEEPSGEMVTFDPEKHKIFGNVYDSGLEEVRRKGFLRTSPDKLQLCSVEVEGGKEKSRKYIRSYFPQSISWGNDDQELVQNELKQKFSRDCRVRAGNQHFARQSEVDLESGPPDGGDTFKVKLISTLPQEAKKGVTINHIDKILNENIDNLYQTKRKSQLTSWLRHFLFSTPYQERSTQVQEIQNFMKEILDYKNKETSAPLSQEAKAACALAMFQHFEKHIVGRFKKSALQEVCQERIKAINEAYPNLKLSQEEQLIVNKLAERYTPSEYKKPSYKGPFA